MRVAIRGCMSNASVKFSREVIQPTRLRAAAFIAACGLASATGAIASALSYAPKTRAAPPRDTGHSEQYLDDEEDYDFDNGCIPHSVNVAATRDDVFAWLDTAARDAEGRPQAYSTRDPHTPVLRIDRSKKTDHERMGLKAGDEIRRIQNVNPYSADRLELLSSKLRLEEPDMVVIGLLRDSCPVWLSWRIP